MGQTPSAIDTVAIEDNHLETPSDFYQACRIGDVEAVKKC